MAYSVTSTAVEVAISERHMSSDPQNDDASSFANRIPPIGAPNAAANPAAAPIEMKSRRSVSFANVRANHGQRTRQRAPRAALQTAGPRPP